MLRGAVSGARVSVGPQQTVSTSSFYLQANAGWFAGDPLTSCGSVAACDAAHRCCRFKSRAGLDLVGPCPAHITGLRHTRSAAGFTSPFGRVHAICSSCQRAAAPKLAAVVRYVVLFRAHRNGRTPSYAARPFWQIPSLCKSVRQCMESSATSPHHESRPGLSQKLRRRPPTPQAPRQGPHPIHV